MYVIAYNIKLCVTSLHIRSENKDALKATRLLYCRHYVLFIRTQSKTGITQNILYTYICVSVETGSGHPGQPGHIFSGSSGSDPVYKLSGSDPDWIT